MYSEQYSGYSEQCTVYSVQCRGAGQQFVTRDKRGPRVLSPRSAGNHSTVYKVLYSILYNCTVYSVQSTVYSLQCMVYSVQSTSDHNSTVPCIIEPTIQYSTVWNTVYNAIFNEVSSTNLFSTVYRILYLKCSHYIYQLLRSAHNPSCLLALLDTGNTALYTLRHCT